ncbi:MAG: DUF2520 domain-containing protein [Bryobacteraceae bacterium]
MRRSPSLALMGGGRVSQSFVARLPRLAPRLGPVAALSYRVACRIANTLRAGDAVRDYAPFDVCKLILVWVPEEQLAATLTGLASAPVNWTAKSVVLCGSWRGSEALEELERRGASCASLDPIDTSESKFLAEGGALAIQRIRDLIGGARERVMEVSRESKPLYLAGMTLAGDVLVPLLVAAAESLRAAGLASAPAASILQVAVHQATRGCVKAGRKAWRGPLAVGERAALERQIEALRAANPALEKFFRRTAAAALELFNKDAAWLGGDV